MRVIYLDSLIFFELTADFALLWAAARLCGLRFSFLRGLGSAAFGAAYSAGAVFVSVLAVPPLKICALALMILIAYGGEKRIWRPALAFLAASSLFAGLCLALNWAGEETYSVRTLLIALGLSLGLCALPFGFIGAGRGIKKKSFKQSVHVKIVNLGAVKELTALYDTGNRLREPISGGGVLVVPEEEAYRLLDGETERILKESRGKNAADRFLRLKGFRLVPYEAVGVKGGMLLAFRPESVFVEGEKKTDIWVALSPTEIGGGDAREYSALINSDAVG
jgi:stage II sporulation protein GA (sporulation sigma-E factor processing peptidase)